MSSKYIQFRGASAVMKAYQMQDVEAWAIFNGKELFTKGCGIEMLKQMLTMLENSGCTYTLKVYQDFDDDSLSQIKDKTPYDGSFTFKLINEEEDFGPYTYSNQKNKLLQRIEALEKEKADLLDEEEETLEDILIGAIKEPQKLLGLVNTAKAIFGITPTFAPQFQTAQTMGNVEQVQQNTNVQKHEWSEDELMRIGNAIDVMKRYDESIVEHLEKLSKIAINNTGQFNFLINALNTM